MVWPLTSTVTRAWRMAERTPSRLLLHVEQLDSGPGPVGELDELRFAAIEIDGAEQRLAPGLVLHGRLGDREGGEQCEYELHRAPQAEAAAMRRVDFPSNQSDGPSRVRQPDDARHSWSEPRVRDRDDAGLGRRGRERDGSRETGCFRLRWPGMSDARSVWPAGRHPRLERTRWEHARCPQAALAHPHEPGDQ